MFKKQRKQLTLFCTLVTGGIFLAMSLLCLMFSENSIRQNHRQAFQSALNSMVSYLENQTVVTGQWIAKTEGGGRLLLNLYDNGKPFHYNSLSGGENKKIILEKAQRIAAEEYGLNIFQPSANAVLSRRVDFNMKSEGGERYYGAAMVFPRKNGALSAVAVYPLAPQEREILLQRLLFAAIDLLGVGALAAFAYFFTGRTLRPIEESREKQAQFVAAASHELRSPLTVMLSNLSALKKADPRERGRFEENIQAEGARMSRLIDDMLALANADSHSWSICRAPVETDTLALELYERFSGLAREKGIQLRVALPEGPLPKCQCDGGRVEQALSVLLDNALCYTPSGGQVTLEVTAQPGGRTKFTVQDNGPGVPKEEKELIFQRFYRADSSRQDKEHFGLGLCVAKEIAQLHKGRLWVEDAPGGGAAFHLVL